MSGARGHVLFRFDAGTALGGGHAMRCLGLADALAESGIPCTFVVRETTFDALPALAARADMMTIADGKELDETVTANATKADWLVVDHPSWDARRMRAARHTASAVMVVSDMPGADLDCDLMLDTTAGREPRDYNDLVPAECTVLTGPSYALLRPAFSALRRRSLLGKRQLGKPPHVLVGFGATDPHGSTIVALDALERACPDARVDVVLGSSVSCLDAIRARVDEKPATMSLHIDSDDVANLMFRADFAIGAAGITSWERCCVGLPAIVITQAANQQDNASALARHKAAMVIGDHETVSVDEIAGAISIMIDTPKERCDMVARAAALCDGLGARHIAQRLFPERARGGGLVVLRPAKADDSEILFQWQTHPETRRYFRDPRVPTRSEHNDWLAKRLVDPDCIFRIVEHAGAPSGVLRLDALGDMDERREDGLDSYEISVVTAPNHWGLGIGTAALRLGRRLMPYAMLHAFVHPENAASHRLFTKAGYRRIGKGYVLAAPESTLVQAQ